jgi:hypothetical protein
MTPSEIAAIRYQAERPFGSRPENPELIRRLVDEIERLNQEIRRLRRSVE